MKFQDDLFAQQLRDEGIDRVIRNNHEWFDAARNMVRTAAAGFEGTGEDLRMKLLLQGLPEPRSSGAWGALCRWAQLKGILRGTGVYRRTSEPKNHACKRQVLRGLR